MKKKRNYVSPLWLQLIPGDDVVTGEGSGQAGFDWAGVACTTFDVTATEWGDVWDSAGNKWAYGPYDPNTTGRAWTLYQDMAYWSIEDNEEVTVPAGTQVDFETLSACLDWTGECGGDMGGGGF